MGGNPPGEKEISRTLRSGARRRTRPPTVQLTLTGAICNDHYLREFGAVKPPKSNPPRWPHK